LLVDSGVLAGNPQPALTALADIRAIAGGFPSANRTAGGEVLRL
jgi:hypothetical protein